MNNSAENFINNHARVLKRQRGKCLMCKEDISDYARDVYSGRGALKGLTCNNCWSVLITIDSSPEVINRCINYHYGRPLRFQNFNLDCTPKDQIYDGQIE